MRLGLGLFLTFIGAAVMLTGIGFALFALISLYRGVLDDPMGDNAGAAEPGDIAQQGMYRGVIIGAVGIPPFLIGMVMVKGAIARKIARAARRSSKP